MTPPNITAKHRMVERQKGGSYRIANLYVELSEPPPALLQSMVMTALKGGWADGFDAMQKANGQWTVIVKIDDARRTFRFWRDAKREGLFRYTLHEGELDTRVTAYRNMLMYAQRASSGLCDAFNDLYPLMAPVYYQLQGAVEGVVEKAIGDAPPRARGAMEDAAQARGLASGLEQDMIKQRPIIKELQTDAANANTALQLLHKRVDALEKRGLFRRIAAWWGRVKEKADARINNTAHDDEYL